MRNHALARTRATVSVLHLGAYAARSADHCWGSQECSAPSPFRLSTVPDLSKRKNRHGKAWLSAGPAGPAGAQEEYLLYDVLCECTCCRGTCWCWCCWCLRTRVWMGDFVRFFLGKCACVRTHLRAFFFPGRMCVRSHALTHAHAHILTCTARAHTTH